MASPTDRQIADWLVHLAALAPVPGRDPAALAEAIRELTPVLRNRYSGAEFDSFSREHVARQCRFFPSYAELCDALDSLPSRAPKPAIAAPVDDLQDMDRHWLAYWFKRCDEIMQMPAGPRRDQITDNLKSLVQAQSRKAWAIICPESVVIYDRPSDGQVVAVARALRMPGGPLAGRPMPDEQAKPRPAPVSDEALRAMRAARGIVVTEASADDVYGEAMPA